MRTLRSTLPIVLTALISLCGVIEKGHAADAAAAAPSATCAGPVVLSASGYNLKATGSQPAFSYPDHAIAQPGNSWVGNSAFRIPAGCNGTYLLNAEFARADFGTVPTGCFAKDGDPTDVRLSLTENGNAIGSTMGAWASSNTPFASASYTLVAKLKAGHDVATVLTLTARGHSLACLKFYGINIARIGP